MNPKDYLQDVILLAKRAGEAILEVYHSEDIEQEQKSDDSPLTRADLASHRVIVDGLRALTPDIPVLSEESKGISAAERQSWPTYWLVDPLDGTKEFIARNDEFTVNIALIDNNQSVLGVIYVPVFEVTYSAAKEHGAFKQERSEALEKISVRKVPSDKGTKRYTVVASRRHGLDKVEKLCRQMPSFDLASRGSSLKMCLVAEGKADLYPRLAPTSEWDTAAAQIIVEEAGGQLVRTDFEPMRYNTKDELLNPHFYVLGDNSEDWKSLLRNS
ncbi:MAG: 3'(2'),5'-bisphosphate nucleotidase CysQ [Gammaproteobacteria bacterium]|nr:3'(2'),5'-bisphosphate nucleotidase CysQ [Gammaproteobacteria bacterium]